MNQTLIAIREVFSHMGAHSGYDLLYKKNDSNRIDIKRNQGYCSLEEWNNTLSILEKFNVSLPIRSLKNKILPKSISPQNEFQQVFPAIKKTFNISPTIFYNMFSLVAECKAIQMALNNPNQDFLIHYSYIENQFGLLASDKLKAKIPNITKIIATSHQPHSWWRLLGNPLLLTKCDQLIVLSHNEKNFWEQTNKNIECFPHGIDLSFFNNQRKEKRQNKDFTCIFSGQWLRDINSLSLIIKATIKLDPKIKFKLIYPFEKRNQPHLRDTLIELTKFNQVEWFCDLSDEELKQQYIQSDILVLPLIDCTANNAILEAMSCGLPIITSDLEALHTYITDEFARFIPNSDIDLYVKSIIELKNETQIKNEMSAKASEHANLFSWDKISSLTYDLIYQ